MNKSVDFIKAIETLALKVTPDIVINRAKKSLIDYVCVTCAGAKFQKEKMHGYFQFIEPEKGVFRAIGIHKDVSLKEAVFLNGLNSHALDFDDGTNSGIIHLGSPIFSLLLPLAQKFNKTVGDVIHAAVLGYEASYTMAVSIQPKHKALGFHATGTCGVIGATIAASYLLDFNHKERFNAFSTACLSSSGMLKVLDDGSELKPYNVAKSALLALTSLQLAKAGFIGNPDPLGGNRGFFKMMSRDEDITLKPILLNGSYAIMKSYTKPYASCRYTHPAVEAAIIIKDKYGIDLSKIKKVLVKTYDLAVSGHDHKDVLGSYSAKMSIPYSVAVGLMYGKAGLQEFDESIIKNHAIKQITNKIDVIADDELSKAFPSTQTAIVEVFVNESSYVERVDFPKGEPENPLSDKEFEDRAYSLMRYAEISDEDTSEICMGLRILNTDINDVLQRV